MFQHILLPLDFTEKNDRAITLAGEMAGTSEARLTLLHVIEKLEGVPDDEIEDFYSTLVERARQALCRLQTDLEKEKVDVRSVVLCGKRAEEIVRHAATAEVELIVMSSRRLDPDSPAPVWPTISHSVAILAPCPILLVR